MSTNLSSITVRQRQGRSRTRLFLVAIALITGLTAGGVAFGANASTHAAVHASR